MNISPSHEQLLTQIAQIQHMERGKLCVIRQGPDRPYYNCQSRENGKNFSRYVPANKVQAYQEAIEAYQRFCQLTEQYADTIIQRTRAELAGDSKKKTSPRSSSWRRKPNSSKS
jgi:hypothetical protein